jgi:hypothetical protein
MTDRPRKVSRFDVLLWPKPGDSNPFHYLCGRRAELRFTAHRPPSGEVSPCCHRPSGGDISCSVHVGVAGPGGAGLALENRLALAVSGCDMSARGASLRRVRGRDLLDATRGFVLQTGGEQTPSASADASVETALLCDTQAGLLDAAPRRTGHRTHIQGLDTDRVEPARDIRGRLFDPVLSAVRLTGLEFGDRTFRASSPVGATFGAGEALLQHRQPPGLTAAQAGRIQQFAGRQGGRNGNSTVDTHHAALTRTGDRIRDVSKRDVPAAGPIRSDTVGPHIVWNRTRQAEPDPADLGHPHPTEPAVQTLDVMRFDRDLTESLMYTGFAPRRTAMRSAEEVAHRLGEIPQRLLLHRLRTGRKPVMFGTRRGQLCALLAITRRAATRLTVLLLLDRQVPHVPGVTAMLSQHHRLFSGRKQPISRHTCNLTRTTDNPMRGDAAFPPPAEARSYHAATAR